MSTSESSFNPSSSTSSDSRKRSHAQMTRSSSRSLSPPPSKRRRTNADQIPTRPTSRSPSPGLSYSDMDLNSLFNDDEDEVHTLSRDFDSEGYQSRHRHQQALISPTFIDLTNDSPPPPPPRSQSQPDTTRRPTPMNRRAPPFPARPTRRPLEIIDLLDSDDEAQARTHTQPEPNHLIPIHARDPPSPDIVITGSRALPQRPILPAIGNLTRTLPPPPLTRSNAQSFENQLRRIGDQALPGAAQGFFERFAQRFGGGLPFGTMGHILPNFLGPQPGIPENLDLEIYDPAEHEDVYDDVTMDYERQGWAFDDAAALHRGSEIPNETAYKAPPSVQDGFTRTFREDEVLLCAGCDEELAQGDEDEPRSQVWASKKCGHVYCGNCASRNVPSRGGNSRQRKAVLRDKHGTYLKECKVEACGAKLTGRASGLFQIYL